VCDWKLHYDRHHLACEAKENRVDFRVIEFSKRIALNNVMLQCRFENNAIRLIRDRENGSKRLGL
jgi:hypothetical protein